MKRSILASLFALLFACDPAPEQARRADAPVTRAPMGLLAFADETRMFAESTTTGVDDAADAPLSTSSGEESTSSSTGGTDSTSGTDSSTTEPPPPPIYSPYVDCSYPVGHPEMGEAICEGCVGRDELGFGYLYPEYGGPTIPAYCPIPCDPSLGELGGWLCEDFMAAVTPGFETVINCVSAVVNGPKSCLIYCEDLKVCPIGMQCLATNTVGHGQVVASYGKMCLPIPGWVHP